MNGTAENPAELVAWYAEAGVTEALDETPHDRFAEAQAAPARAAADAAASATRQMPARDRAPPGQDGRRGEDARPLAAKPPAARVLAAEAATPEAAALGAKALAQQANTLAELADALGRFQGCALKATAKSLVFADGNPAGRVMLVGEAPGADEDRLGVPFVGRSGQLLDRMLAAIGLNRREHVYIANLLPWRPPGNRTPTPQEVAVCLPFIQRQIALADPDVLVCVGAPSALALLGMTGILASRGKWVEYDTGARRIRALATLHPAYLLRQPLQKRLAWRDMRAIKAALDETG